MITRLAISGYRSLREIRVPLGALNVVTGANGSGKSSLYRALRLLADVAQGRIIQSLAGEGGLHSTLWAGPESFARSVKKGEQPVQGTVRKASISLKLGFAGDDYGYAIDLGLPRPVFMTVGRVAVEKNLEAFLSLDLPGTKVIVGTGPQEAELKRKFPDAKFLGMLDNGILASHLAGADVFVFPSLTDTFGIVQLEALASRVPVARISQKLPP